MVSPPPSPPLLLARGWERFGRRGILKFFLLSLAGALLASERLQSTSDCVQRLLVPFLRCLGPPTPFLGKKALCFAKGEWPEGVAGEEGGCGQPA